MTRGLVVVAAFEPFGGRSQNRSWEVVRRLPERPGLEVVRLPVNYGLLPEAASSLLARGPRALLLVGETSQRAVAVEQIALNLSDSDQLDNAGRKHESQPLVAGAPLALRAPWDARAVARALHHEGIRANASNHAGTFACNAALYHALHAAPAGVKIGFLHVPRKKWPFGPRTSHLVRAAEVAIAALVAIDTVVAGDAGVATDPVAE